MKCVSFLSSFHAVRLFFFFFFRRKVNKGHGIENVHSLGDGLWKYVPEKSD